MNLRLRPFGKDPPGSNRPVFRRAGIPDEGTLAVVVFSREHGELLISTGKGTTVVHNFTTKKTLYESKGR